MPTTRLQCYITIYFYLPPHYEPTAIDINIYFEVAKLNMINISALDFHIWQHLENPQNETLLQDLASIPSVPVNQLYKHMISSTNPITPFTSHVESTGDTVSIWTLFSHTGVYVMPIGSLLPAGLGIFAVISFGANLADSHADLYNQVPCIILVVSSKNTH